MSFPQIICGVLRIILSDVHPISCSTDADDHLIVVDADLKYELHNLSAVSIQAHNATQI